MLARKLDTSEAHITTTHTELSCYHCSEKWVAKTRIEPKGIKVSARPGNPARRGASSAIYRHIHHPSWCPKCKRGYTGVVGPRVVNGVAP